MNLRIIILALVALLASACTLGSADRATDVAIVPSVTAFVPNVSATPRPTNTLQPTLTPRPTQRAPVVVLPPTITNCTPRADWQTYTVVAGDTAFRIAQRAGTTVSALAAANCLANADRIEVGQVLRVPVAIGVPTNTPPPTVDAGEPIRFYLIIPDDNGATGPLVGCGDSVFGVSTDGRKTGVIANDVRAGLDALFGVDTYDYGQSGFVNELYDDPLTVNNVQISGDTLVVQLDGTLMGVGTCADARVQAQILHTIFEHPGFNRVRVMVGSQNMRQMFDMSGLLGPDAVYERDSF